MDSEITQTVKQIMKKKKLTHDDLAQLTGIQRSNITRMLSGKSGKIPANWKKVLDALELKIKVAKK